MIHCVLIINTSGQPRLAKFYTPLDVHSQQALIKQIHTLLSARNPSQSNVLTLPDLLKSSDGDDSSVKVIYRQYATLNFVFVADQQESELGILDLMHVFVKALDKCFTNVCELDLEFGWETLETVLEELIQGGLVLETKVQNIVDAVDSANRQSSSGSKKSSPGSGDAAGWRSPVNFGFGWSDDPLTSASKTFSDAALTFRSYFPGR